MDNLITRVFALIFEIVWLLRSLKLRPLWYSWIVANADADAAAAADADADADADAGALDPDQIDSLEIYS